MEAPTCQQLSHGVLLPATQVSGGQEGACPSSAAHLPWTLGKSLLPTKLQVLPKDMGIGGTPTSQGSYQVKLGSFYEVLASGTGTW